MSNPLIGIIVGSTRQGRMGEIPAHWIYGLALQRRDLRLELIDLRDHPLPFFDEPASPLVGRAAAAQRWAAVLDRLDGFIVVTPQDGRRRSAALMNAPDSPYKHFARKPVAFVSYGCATGAIAAESLRARASQLQMAPVSGAVHISMAEIMSIWSLNKSFDDYPRLGGAANAMLDDVSWWARALRAARAEAANASPVMRPGHPPQPAAVMHASARVTRDLMQRILSPSRWHGAMAIR